MFWDCSSYVPCPHTPFQASPSSPLPLAAGFPRRATLTQRLGLHPSHFPSLTPSVSTSPPQRLGDSVIPRGLSQQPRFCPLCPGCHGCPLSAPRGHPGPACGPQASSPLCSQLLFHPNPKCRRTFEAGSWGPFCVWVLTSGNAIHRPELNTIPGLHQTSTWVPPAVSRTSPLESLTGSSRSPDSEANTPC